MLRTFKILMWHYILHINCAWVKCCCAHRIATKSADSGTYIAHNLRYMIATGEFQVTHRNTWDGTNTEEEISKFSYVDFIVGFTLFSFYILPPSINQFCPHDWIDCAIIKSACPVSQTLQSAQDST